MNDLFTEQPIEWYDGGDMSSAHTTTSWKRLEMPDSFVLVCYPRDGTPVCTKELNELQANLEDFTLPVYAASTDSPESHSEFFTDPTAFPEDIEYPVLSIGNYMLTDLAKQLLLNEYGYCHRIVVVVMEGSVVSIYRTPDEINPDMKQLVKLVKQITEA